MNKSKIAVFVMLVLFLFYVLAASAVKDPEENWDSWDDSEKISCANTAACRENMFDSHVNEVLSMHSLDLKADTLVEFYKEGKITKEEFNSYHNYMWENHPDSEYTHRMNKIWTTLPTELRKYVGGHYSAGAMQNFKFDDLLEVALNAKAIDPETVWEFVKHFFEMLIGKDEPIKNLEDLPSDLLEEALQSLGYNIDEIDLNDQPTTLEEDGILNIDGTELDLETFTNGSYEITAYPDNLIQINDNLIKNADYIAALDGDGLFVNHSDYWSKEALTVVNGTNITFYKGGFQIGYANSVIQDRSISTVAYNYTMSLDSWDSFYVERADMIFIDGITFYDVYKTWFFIYMDSIEAKPAFNSTLKIMDECFSYSSFKPLGNDSSIEIVKGSCADCIVKEGYFSVNKTGYNDSLECLNTCSVVTDAFYGFVGVAMKPASTYFYNDDALIKDFAIHLPENSSEYNLCIRKDEIQDISFAGCDGFVDFVNKSIKLKKVINYMRYAFDENQALTDLVMKDVYKGKNEHNNATIELGDDFIFVDELFIENNKIECNNESILAEVHNLNYHIIEICNDKINEPERYVGFQHNNPAVIKQYNSNFGIEHSPILFNNKIMAIKNQNTESKLYSSDIAKNNYKQEMDSYMANFECSKYYALFDEEDTIYNWYLR